MEKINFNKNWEFIKGVDNSLASQIHGIKQGGTTVDLPHDAMILETREKDTPNGSQSGFFPGGTYSYTKKFFVSKDWQQKQLILEFEGIYHHSRIYINGHLAEISQSGYRSIFVDLFSYVEYDQENEVKVTVNNADMPNSRSYTGSGLYREAHLWIGDLCHVKLNETKILVREVSTEVATVEVSSVLVNQSRGNEVATLVSKIYSNEQLVAEYTGVVTLIAGKDTKVSQRIAIENPNLWSPDDPALYQLEQTLIAGNQKDQVVENFGIRTIALNPLSGFQLNNQSIKLRGTCIHHDNGVLGARAYYDAEVWKVEQLKKAGFNCIRMSHQPMGKSLLKACDEVGMLVIDELSDMWLTNKNDFDDSDYFYENWESEVEAMVIKNYNHPSVIMYSTGNEIQEAGNYRGAALSREINAKFKELDPYRYTTVAINALTAISSDLPLIFADAQKMQKENSHVQEQPATEKDSLVENSATKDKSGSNELNGMMSILKGGLADLIAQHPITTQKIREFSESVDVTGYNYMTARHQREHSLYPNRVIMGSETFPSDIAQLWEIVETCPHVIGDMTWTGLDYLGEAALGGVFYNGESLENKWPYRTADCGDIDITGYRKPISYYREIIFGLRKAPFIAVDRMDKNQQTMITTPWTWKDNLDSWTWKGFEDEIAQVTVCSNADEVELLVNGVSQGIKPVGKDKTVDYRIPYVPGVIEAINYRNGQKSEKHKLETAETTQDIQVSIWKNEKSVEGLLYIDLLFVDKNQRAQLQEIKEVRIKQVENTEILAFGSGNPKGLEAFNAHKVQTYDGHLLLVAKKISDEAGIIEISFDDQSKTIHF